MSGCETETNEDALNKSSFKIKEMPIHQLLKIDKFNNSLQKIGLKMNSPTDISFSRTGLEDEFNFTIVDTPAKVIEEANKTTYTMLIERDLVDFNVIENLVVQIDDSNKMVAIIIKYNSVGEVIKTADGSYIFSTDDKEITTILNENGATNTEKVNCISYKMCSNCVGTYTSNHFAGSQCTLAQFYYTYFECSYSNDPHNPMGYGGSSGGGGNTGGNGGGSSSANSSGVATAPVGGLESHEMILKKRKFYHTYLNSVLLENFFMQLPAVQKNIIFTYLENNSMDEGFYDAAPMAFIKEAITRMIANPTLFQNIVPLIIEKQIDDSALSPCVKGIVGKIKNLQQNDFAAIIAKLGGANTPYNVKIIESEVSSTDPTAVASTTFIPGTQLYSYEIKLKPSYLSTATNLSIASTIQHELLHAYFLSLVADYAATHSSNSVLNSFPELWDFYAVHFSPNANPNVPEHNTIASNFIGIQSSSLQEFHTGIPISSNTQPQQLYRDLAWGGLEETIPYNNVGVDRLLSENDKIRINGVNYAEAHNTIHDNGNNVPSSIPQGIPCN